MAKKTAGRNPNRMGSIFKDGSGYRVQILLRHDPTDGKPVYKKVRAKTHAEAVEALQRLQHETRLRPVATPTGLTFASYVEDWLESHILPAKAPKTYQQYRWVLTLHVVPSLGKKRVDGITRQDVQALITNLAKQKVRSRAKVDPHDEEARKADAAKIRPNLSRRTLELAIAVLRSAFENAIRDGLATANPATYITLPKAINKPASFLTSMQVAQLNGKLVNSPIKELVHFMLATGTRLGEATGIRWKDIDLNTRFVSISGQLQREDGKLAYREITKTNQDRILTIPQWLCDELREMKSRQMVSNHIDDLGVAFLNAFGRRFDPKYFNLELAASCSAAGIPRISAHKLRHTAATLALQNTGDLHAVQKMLGHSQVALTSNLYGHANAERLRPVGDALGALVRPSNDE
jgi:integrase